MRALGVRPWRWGRTGGTSGALVALTALAPAVPVPSWAQAAPAVPSWAVASGDVRVRCRLTVGGAFEAVTSSLAGTLQSPASGTVSYPGEFRVDLATLDTGINLRNEHLWHNYLQVEHGPAFRHAVLSDIALEAPLPARTGHHETTFSGTLAFHGVQRAIVGEIDLRRRDDRVRVEAMFTLSLDAFGVPPPRYLGIGVRDVIEVTVRFDAVDGETAAEGPS